jgi:hypothetical protein
LAALAAIVLALAAGGVAYASIPDSSGVINGCYKSVVGQLRVIDTDAGMKCLAGEKPLDWSRSGPTGATGPTGTSGISGYEIVRNFFSAPAPQRCCGVVFAAECPTGKSVLGGGGFAQWSNADGFIFPTQLTESLPAGTKWEIVETPVDDTAFPEGATLFGEVFAVCAYVSS